MEIKVKTLVLCLIGFVLVFVAGYGLGYVGGLNKAMETTQSLEKMYDEHINRQWNMIEKRDTLYVNALRLKLNYTDGHTLTPEE